MFKKAKLSSTYSGIQCSLCAHTSSSNTSPTVLPNPRARSRTQIQDHINRCLNNQKRSYADTKSSRSYDFRDNMNWPQKPSPAAPTPYEIFDLERGGVYSKHKFYELVKIYHPDMNTSGRFSNDGLTHLQRLERYRMIVQAHEILSDPIKRKAYDSYGAGWGEGRASPTRRSRGYSSNTGDGKTYGYGPDHDSSPFANATWEDWERWYRRADPSQKQAYAGTYINPNAFASFVILLAVLSGVAQATRAGQYSGTFEERAHAFTEETSRFLTSRAEHFAEHKMSADGRIKHFLQKRDPSKYGLKDEEEVMYRKHFAHEQTMPPPAKESNKSTNVDAEAE